MQSLPTQSESPSPDESPLPDARNNQPHNGRRRLRCAFVFAWFDLWVGLYYDRNKRQLYFLPLPFIGVKFWFEPAVTAINTTAANQFSGRFPDDDWYLDPVYTIGRLHQALLHDVQWLPPTEGRLPRQVENAHWHLPEHALKQMLEIFRHVDRRSKEKNLRMERMGRRP